MESLRVSKMSEDYLKILWKAQEWPGGSVSTSVIASTLRVTPSSVSANLKKLARDGLIDYEPYGNISLTGDGRDIAVLVVRRHRVLETYLHEHLGLGWDQVHAEADSLEHAVSDLVLDRMDQVLGYPSHDPHGDQIPRADGTLAGSRASSPAVLLSEINAGTDACVIRISDREPTILQYLAARKITIGTRFRVESRDIAAGSLSVIHSSLGKGGVRVEIAAGAAEAVWVRADKPR